MSGAIRFALLAVTLMTAFAADTSPFHGVWKLNLTRSRYETPAPKAMTVTMTATTTTVEQVDGAGESVRWSFDARTGESVPINGIENSSVTVKRNDAHTVEHLWTMGGARSTGRGVISSGGRAMTYTLKGTLPEGRAYTNVLVFEKQR